MTNLHSAKPARIVHLTSAHPWDETRVFHKMCRWLARAGADVHLVAAHGPKPPGEIVEGVRVHLLSQPRDRRERMTRTRKEAWRKALSLDPDLVHLHDPELLLGRPWLARPEVHVIYDAHEDLREQVTIKKWLPLPKRMLSWAVGRMEERLSASAHGVITVDPAIVRRFPGREVPLVRNFPDLDALDAIKPAERPPGAEDKWVALCAGTLGEDRGTGSLVRVFEHLPDKFEMWLIGNVPAEQLAEWKTWPGWRRVRYFPRMEHKAVVALEKVANVVLHVVPPRAQYQWALYPVKGLESMACGVPLVMSDFECFRKTFGGAAVFVDPENPRAVASALNRLAEDSDRVREMHEHGRHLVREQFDWAGEFQKLAAEYGRVSPAFGKLEVMDYETC